MVDGGSIDGTQALIQRAAAEDGRFRVIDASPVPEGVNGKAWGLHVGIENARSDTPWILTVDADVRLSSDLTRSMLIHAEREDVPALSAATTQMISGPALGMLHPSMLTTLVYRFGIPGSVTTDVRRVQANGQCFLIRRDVLEAIGGFRSVFGSVCEDVTLARRAAVAGFSVGFYETDQLVSVEMHADAADAWRNWTRSLPVRDSLTAVVESVRIHGGHCDPGVASVDSAARDAPFWVEALSDCRQFRSGDDANRSPGRDIEGISIQTVDLLAVATAGSASRIADHSHELSSYSRLERARIFASGSDRMNRFPSLTSRASAARCPSVRAGLRADRLADHVAQSRPLGARSDRG